MVSMDLDSRIALNLIILPWIDTILTGNASRPASLTSRIPGGESIKDMHNARRPRIYIFHVTSRAPITNSSSYLGQLWLQLCSFESHTLSLTAIAHLYTRLLCWMVQPISDILSHSSLIKGCRLGPSLFLDNMCL